MNIKELQEIFAIDKLLKEKSTTVKEDLDHLKKEVDELVDAVNLKWGIPDELADVIFIAVIIANRLDIDLTKAIEDKIVKQIQRKRLRR